VRRDAAGGCSAVVAGAAPPACVVEASAKANHPSVLTACTARTSASRGSAVSRGGNRAIGRSFAKILPKIVRSAISIRPWCPGPPIWTGPSRSRNTCVPLTTGR
jgi:hypothetical protein